MPFEDLLLHLDSYPAATPECDIDAAVAFAAAMGGKLTALTLGVTIPLESNKLADLLIGLSKVIAEEEARSAEACRSGAARFTEKAKAAGVFADVVSQRVDLYAIPSAVARAARTRDLCLVPLGGRYTGQGEVAQTVIFESGRPVLIFRGEEGRFANGVRKVVIAWDGGPFAARAVAEALPILAKAAEVRILTVIGEKAAVHPGVADGLVRHLRAHGVEAVADEVDAKGRKIAEVLDAYVADQAPDLVVMGAYGHSRLQEFILGGATEHALWESKVPTLLSH